MKLNILLFGLSLVSGALLAGCGDYEDVETVSPEADADAIGAYFAENEQSFVLAPEANDFSLLLNRANSEGSTTVQVTTVDAGTVFTNIPTAFQFADGEMESAAVKVGYDKDKVVFQLPDMLQLQIPAKDHPYADGYTSTSVDLTVDYTWVDSVASVVVKDEYIGTEETDQFLVSVQIAKNFDSDGKNPKNKTLIRIKDLYSTAGKAQAAGFAHLQFTLNKDYDASSAALLTSADIEGIKIRTELETGVTENYTVTEGGEEVKKALPVYMEVKSVACADAAGDAETINRSFTVTSELYVKYNGVEYQVNKDELTAGRTSNQTTFTVGFPKPAAAQTPSER